MNDVRDHDAADWRSGKGHRNENFPVASWLIDPRHRAPILAFYNFVRTADDIADHASLPPQEKLDLLDRLESGLWAGAMRIKAWRCAIAHRARSVAEARAGSACRVPARCHQAALSRLGRSDRLLLAVGHAGRPVRLRRARRKPRVWPANDALCAALQIINHLQDCKADFLNLDRVYVPLDALADAGSKVEDSASLRANSAVARLPGWPCGADRAIAPARSDGFAVLDQRPLASVSKWSVINTLAHPWVTRLLMGPRSAEPARASRPCPPSRGWTLAGVLAGAGARRLGRHSALLANAAGWRK